jgi:hypothetical protein
MSIASDGTHTLRLRQANAHLPADPVAYEARAPVEGGLSRNREAR